MSIPRGSTVFFNSIQFKDASGDAVTVDTATLLLRYRTRKKFAEEDVTLAFSAPDWSGSWNSTVADGNATVYAHLEGIRSSPEIRIVIDFEFRLTQNKANEAHHD